MLRTISLKYPTRVSRRLGHGHMLSEALAVKRTLESYLATGRPEGRNGGLVTRRSREERSRGANSNKASTTDSCPRPRHMVPGPTISGIFGVNDRGIVGFGSRDRPANPYICSARSV